jgi:hypothetical protein
MRNIEPKMVAFIDKKLALNGAAQEAIEKKDARSLMVFAAEACVGIRESGGNNKGPLVQLIQDTVGGVGAEAWCMSFVQTCIAYAEVKTGVKSPLLDTEHCTTLWNKTKASQKVKIFPARGAIIIWQHGKGPSGHTGFFLEGDGKSMRTIEGNTEAGFSKDGSVVREGGGVYLASRSMKANGTMKVLGFIKPF